MINAADLDHFLVTDFDKKQSPPVFKTFPHNGMRCFYRIILEIKTNDLLSEIHVSLGEIYARQH